MIRTLLQTALPHRDHEAGALNRRDRLAGSGLSRCARNRSAKRPSLQPRLRIGATGDHFEREADHFADAIMNMPFDAAVDRAITPLAGPVGDGGTVPPAVARVASGEGSTLDAGVRSFVEPRFGMDFSHVRVHTGTAEAAAADALGARAFTLGNDVVFGRGEYRPMTHAGRRLLAHELTHVVQQGEAAIPGVQRQQAPDSTPESILPPADPARAEQARQRVAAFVRGGMERIRLSLRTGRLLELIEEPHSEGVQGPRTRPAINRVESFGDRRRRLFDFLRTLGAFLQAYESGSFVPTHIDWSIRLFLEGRQAPPGLVNPDRLPEGYSLPDSEECGNVIDEIVAGHFDDSLGYHDSTIACVVLACYMQRIGMDTHLAARNLLYLFWRVMPPGAPGERHQQTRPATQLGIQLVVRAPRGNPHDYTRLGATMNIPPGAIVVEVQRDSFGTFYMYRGTRIDLAEGF